MRIVGAVVLVVFGVRTLWQARRSKERPESMGEAAEKSGWASYRGVLPLLGARLALES